MNFVKDCLEDITNTLQPQIPNLDAYSIKELCAFQEGFQQLSKDFERLADYAQRKQFAMSLREAGNIQAALAIEKLADSIYNNMPNWSKW